MNDSTSKWKDKEFKKAYNKQYRERLKLQNQAASSPTEEGKEMTVWKKRQLQKQASQVRPLLLPKCPFCEGEFLKRVNGKLEPMKLNSCSTCDVRFYYAGGKIQ